MTPLAGIALVLGSLILGAALVQAVAAWRNWHPELSRKALHVLLGVAALPFPWLFDRLAPVAVVAGVVLACLLALRTVPWLRTHLGAALHGVNRTSYGELCHPVAIAALFSLSGGDPVTYGIPLLILTVADPIAALTGGLRGRVRYQAFGGTKSVEGSLAFCAAATAVTYLPLLLAGAHPLSAFALAMLTGILSTLAESIAWRGLDNALIPIGSFVVLDGLIGLPPAPLLARCAVLAFGLAVAVSLLRERARPTLTTRAA